MSTPFDRFWAQLGNLGDGKYQPALRFGVVGPVESVSEGGDEATGPLDGSGQFTVPVKGRAVARGEYLLVSYAGDQPVGAELSYVRHVASDYQGAGLVVVDANLPAPTFAVTPWTTAIVKLPGSITAKASVFFNAVEARYQPTGYTVSFRVDGGEWADRAVPHGGGVQECNLGSDLPPGADVDVHLRARYAWAASESTPTADQIYQTAEDDSSPGDVTAIAVDLSVPNTLHLKLTTDTDPDLLRGYVYEFNDAASGSPDIVTAALPPEWDAVLPPGTYYVAAYPISKAGVAGGREPSTGFQGPHEVIDQSANLDTTPPSAMGAPTLTGRTVQNADNAWHGYLNVAFPAYSPPDDIGGYEVSIVCDDGRRWIESMPVGSAEWDGEVGFGEFTVALRAVDQAQNKPAFGATAVEAIAAPALANTAPTVGTVSVGAGIKVSWNRIDGALAYEIQRATDGSGTGATTIGTTSALWFLDTLTGDTLILPTYHYRVRPTSMQNGSVIQGTYSSWVAGTVGAIDAQNLRVASIVSALIGADQIVANHIAAGEITAAKLAATLLITQLLRTAASGTRWEIEGATGDGDQMQIRAYETISGTDRLRLMMNGTGLYVYGDAAQGDISLNRNGSGRGQLAAHGVTIANDGVPYIAIDLNSSGELRMTGPSVAGKWIGGTFGSTNVLNWRHDSVGTFGDALLALYDNRGGGGGNDKLGLHYNGLGVRSNSFGGEAEWKYSSGINRWVSGQNLGGLSLFLDTSGQVAFGSGLVQFLRANDRFGNAGAIHCLNQGVDWRPFIAGDIHSYRAANAQHGIIWLGNGSGGGDRYLYWNGSQYVMPGATALINGVTVGSGRASKRGIREATFDRKKWRTLRPKAFRFHDDRDDAPERIGFVAEEVGEAIPGVAIDLGNDPHGKPLSGGKGYSLEGLVAAQQGIIAELSDLVDGLTERVTTLESKLRK